MSFSITGPASAFREVLQMNGRTLKKPQELAEVEDVIFTPPPDFH